MNNIFFLFTTLNDREKASLVWLLIFLCWVLSREDTRKSLGCLLKIFFQTKILSILIAMFVYIFLILWSLYSVHIWIFELTTDTVFWIFGSGIVLLINIGKTTQDNNYFKKILKDNLKLIIILEFIVALYAFNFWIEIIFVPMIFFIVAMSTIAETKKEYSQAKKVIDFVLSIIGISLIMFTIFQIINDYQNFVSLNNLRLFILVPLLSITLIPFLYIMALIMTYETLFVRLEIFSKHDKALVKFAKVKIFKLCFLNLKKLTKFARENSSGCLGLKDKNDVVDMINRFTK